jgi:RNA polymerase sigma factor (sigma-70 family)
MESFMFSKNKTDNPQQSLTDYSEGCLDNFCCDSNIASITSATPTTSLNRNPEHSRNKDFKSLRLNTFIPNVGRVKECRSNKNYETICSEYEHLIIKVINSFKSISLKPDFHDLIQEGFLILCESVEIFDSSDSSNFEEFANQYIQTRLKALRREQLYTPKIFKELLKNGVVLMQLPSMSEREIDEYKSLLLNGVKNLSFKQRLIISRLYGFQSEPTTMRKIAKDLEISYEAVRRLHKRALINLAQNLDLHLFTS